MVPWHIRNNELRQKLDIRIDRYENEKSGNNIWTQANFGLQNLQKLLKISHRLRILCFSAESVNCAVYDRK